MKEIPHQSTFNSTTEWLEAVTEETNTDFDVLKAVASQLRPDLVPPPESDRRDRLQWALERHLQFEPETADGGIGSEADWMSFYFPQGGEVDCYYQYKNKSHNIQTGADTVDEIEVVKSVMELDNEGVFTVKNMGDTFVTAYSDTDGSSNEASLIERILNEVYEIHLEDIERAEVAMNDETIRWISE